MQNGGNLRALIDKSLEDMVPKLQAVEYANIYKNLLDFLYFAEASMQNILNHAKRNGKVQKINNIFF